jgi:hypothetical protein
LCWVGTGAGGTGSVGLGIFFDGRSTSRRKFKIDKCNISGSKSSNPKSEVALRLGSSRCFYRCGHDVAEFMAFINDSGHFMSGEELCFRD